MSGNGTENNFGAVLAVLDRANEALLAELVTEIARVAQGNARRDTNFYADNIKPLIGGQGGIPGKFEVRFSPREQKPVGRQSVAAPALPKGQAAVAALAEYSYFLEREDDTIVDATEYVRGQFSDMVGRVRVRFDLGEG